MFCACSVCKNRWVMRAGCGCGFGCSQVVEHPQDVIFGCVEFASVMCLITVASADAITYQAALQAFGTCASGGGDTEEQHGGAGRDAQPSRGAILEEYNPMVVLTPS